MDKFIRMLKAGKLIAFPTETAYGLGGDATQPGVVKKIAELKVRENDKPFPVIVDSLATMRKYAEIDGLTEFLSARFHPGPLTLVVPSRLPHFSQGIGFRISSSETAHKLTKGLGKPIVASSANLASRKTPYSADEVRNTFPKIPVIDGGRLEKKDVSTIVINREITRKGAVSSELVQAMIIGFDALKKASPDNAKQKDVKGAAAKVLAAVRKHHKDTIVGGSVAKDTFLQDLRDIDLFLLFDPAENLEDKLELLKKIAAELGPVRLEYAQHPYVSTEFGGYKIELVPAYKTKPTNIISAADRSPWHVEWVKKQPAVAKQDAMLLKAFCKGIGVYGADQRVQGFSGYALEVIAAQLGFRGVLEEKLKWPLVLKDPVDPDRNVLASVSKDSFELFERAIDAFLKKPSLVFFFPDPPAVLDKLPIDESLILLEFDKQDKPEDVQWGQLRRRVRSILNQARSAGVHIADTRFWVSDKNRVLLRLDTEPEMVLEGPPVGHSGHCDRFRKKHKNVFEKDGRLWARESAPDALGFLKQFGTLIVKDQIQKAYSGMSEQEKQETSRFFVRTDSWQ